MSKKLWGALIIALIASWLGIKPSLTGSHYSTGHSSGYSSSSRSRSSGTNHSTADITALTSANQVATWIHQHHRLPDYYLTKGQARREGWDPSSANLCDVLPGKAIGGDHFSNREGRMTEASGRRGVEADGNDEGGKRKEERRRDAADGREGLKREEDRTFKRIP